MERVDEIRVVVRWMSNREARIVNLEDACK